MCAECKALQDKVAEVSQRLANAHKAMQNWEKMPDFDLNTGQKEIASIRQEYRVALFSLEEHKHRENH